jgi:hypothetical protein
VPDQNSNKMLDSTKIPHNMGLPIRKYTWVILIKMYYAIKCVEIDTGFQKKLNHQNEM